MLQNVRVTAFTISELLRESQKTAGGGGGGGGKITPFPTQIRVHNEHIQLLHDGNNHWLLSFCFSGRVQICDSLKNHAGRFTLKSINAPYRNFNETSSGILTLLFMLVQKQEDDFNCGAFAIAYSAEFLDGKSPIDA